MGEPRWKRWLSYLIEWHIESAPSETNPHLYVSLRNGRYQLSTAHAVYSYEDLYSNFRKAFERLDLDRLPGDEVLVLGLGLGSIPLMLERVFGESFRYTALEIDESVIYLADKYALSDLSSSVQTICADAHAWVMQTGQRFDLVCMDIFLDDTVPPPFEAVDFLVRLRDLLNPGGLLLYNRLAANAEDEAASRRFYEGPFLSVFPAGTYLDVGGNWMLLNRTDYL